MPRLRVGIIGLGVGERHLGAYASHPDCTVAALCDSSVQRQAELRAKYPSIPVRSQAEFVLDDPEIDLVSIASYDDAHFAQAMRAIGKGKHVFVEKPLCLRDEEAVELRRALKAHPEVRLSSNLVLRTTPRFRLLKRIVDAGEFGELYYIEGDYNYGRLEKLTDGWRGRLDFYSVVHGGAVHMVDLLLWLAGDKVVEVKAYGNRISSQGSAFRFNDMVVAILKFSSGAVGKVSANFGCVMPHYHGLAVYGTRQSFVNGRTCGQIFETRDAREPVQCVSEEYPGKQKDEVICSFLDSITRGTEPIVSMDDAFRATSVCMAIERATHEGGAVKVVEY